METSFRLTAQQYEDIGSRLAANGSRPFIVAECGYSAIEKPFAKVSWMVKNILGSYVHEDLVKCFATGFDKHVLITTEPYLKDISLQWNGLLVGVVQGNESDFKVLRVEKNEMRPLDSTVIAGADICYQFARQAKSQFGFQERTAQAFGNATTDTLSKLTIGIAGASGTGSIVAEQLLRLGVGRIVLVDDDIVEPCNLNRILNSTYRDAENKTKKVDMLKQVYDSAGFQTDVVAIDTVILHRDTVKTLAQCDFLFGCLDSVDGRYQLNRISTFYTIPYLDMGVSINADGMGGINQMSCAVRFVMPGGASLMSRGAISQEQLNADSMRREDPELYAKRLEEKYIVGASESSPAVISINMCTASLAVNEFLARIHPYRVEENKERDTIWYDFMAPRIRSELSNSPDPGLSKHLGCGDIQPLLNMPVLGKGEDCED